MHANRLTFIASGTDNRQSLLSVLRHVIFQNLPERAPAAGLQLACVSRRGYTGSMPFSEAESSAVISGDKQKWQAFMSARGVEVAILSTGL